MSEMRAQESQQFDPSAVAADVSTRSHTFRNVIALPLAATAALLLPSASEVPPKNDMSCADIKDDAFLPHDLGEDGRAIGVSLDPNTIPTAGMEPMKNEETDEPIVTDNGPLLKKPLGSLTVQNGVLVDDKLNIPFKHHLAVRELFGGDQELRAVACEVDTGVAVIGVSETAAATDKYNPKLDAQAIEEAGEDTPEGIELFFPAKNTAELSNERVITYTMIHEGLHAIRARVQNGEINHEAISMIRQFDELYRQHATMIVEEYRSLHGADMIKRLDTIMHVIDSDDGENFDAEDADEVRVAVEFLKDRIKQPNGLADLAVTDDKGPFKNKEVSLNYLNEMLGVAYMKAKGVPAEDVPFSFGSGGGLEVGDADGNPLFGQAEMDLYNFAKERFVAEQVLPGIDPEQGHPEDSNELLASMWVVTRDIGEGRFSDLVVKVSSPYRQLCMQELRLARQMRLTIKPSDIVSNGETPSH